MVGVRPVPRINSNAMMVYAYLQPGNVMILLTVTIQRMRQTVAEVQ